MEDSPRGVEAWKEHTTAFDRVRSIAEALDQARSAKYIAEEAAVSETTAHNHLKRLAEMNVIRTVADENATYYEPDPLYGRFRTLRGLIENHTHQELLELKADLQQQIEACQEQYEVHSPTDLRARATETETAAETMELIEDASDWQLSRYQLSILEDAIDNYEEYAAIDGRLHA
jgi:HTH domain.